MKKLFLFLTLISFHLFVHAQLSYNKIETYHTGTKVTYYPNACDSVIPEAEGKISFCDRAGNLGVVEKSFGLNSPRIDKMGFNYYNNDEIFITQSGVSIRKEDGNWMNFHSYTGPRASVTSNAPSVKEALLSPDGKLFFYHGSMFGLHALNIETMEFETWSYSTSTGGSNNRYTVVISHDEQSDTTYVLSAPGGSSSSHDVYAYIADSLYYKGSVPISKSNSGLASEKFLVKDGYFYIGGNSGLYKIHTQDLSDLTLYNTDSLLPFNRVDDMQFDADGDLWLAMNTNIDGALVRFSPEDESVNFFQFPDPSNPAYNLRFNGVAVDDDHTVWALAGNESGYGKMILDEQGEADFEFFPLQFFIDIGFPMSNPGAVFWNNQKIYFLTRNTSGTTRYEAVIHDNGSWRGVSDDEPGNISARHTRRFQYGYPAEEGVWFFNQYEGIISYWDQNDNFKKHYNMGGLNSLVVDNDNKPVWATSSELKKFDLPLAYPLQDPESNSIARIRRYKDLIYAYNRTARKMLVYRNNNIVAQYQLDEDDYSSLYNFNVDSEGNIWFFKTENSDLLVKKFDITTQSTTNMQANTGTIGALRTIVSMPNGQMCFVGSNAVVVYNEGDFVKFTNNDFSSMVNIRSGTSDINGKLHIYTHDITKIITIENPFDEEPIFDMLVIEGQYTGALPYVGFYRPGGMMLDREGNFWGHGSGKWVKISLTDPVPGFLNLGETYGITGRVYVDVNENNQYDPGEGHANQKVSIVSGDTQFDTYTDQDGMYFFSYMGENAEYSITLPSVSNYVVAEEMQQQITVADFESNFEMEDFKLQPKNISSLVVNSSAKEGLWGFQREGFENSFTTAIGNISFTKTFSDLELQFVFLKEGENLDWELPEMEAIKVYKIAPTGSFHIISLIYINPQNHQWTLNANPDTYTMEELDISPEVVINEEGAFIDFALGSVDPLTTYLIEIDTELFPPEENGNKLKFGIRWIKSSDFSGDPLNPSGSTTVFLIPASQDPRAGGFNDMSPYLNPDDVYSDPPYTDPKDVYADSPYSSRIYSSYDPNDKLVSPGLPDELNLTDIDKKWLTYTVRFQNDGNFSAKDVFIMDVIDPNFDLNTLTVLEHSHPLQLSQIEFEDSVAIKFAFDDIYLDYSDNDLEASQGYVKFMIKANDSIPLGTIVENRASIYFDQNPPIITNTVMNQFVELHNLGLRANPEEGGQVNYNVAGEYQQGEQALLRAMPNAEDEYLFINWTMDGQVVSDSIEFTYTMGAEDALLVANFQKDIPEIYTLSILIDPEEGGQVLVKVDDEEQLEPYSFEEGAEVVLEALAEDNYNFLGWQAGNQSFTDNPIAFIMESSFSVTANFDIESGVTEDVLSGEPQVFPNPASQNITLQSPFLIRTLEIFDVRGVLVFARDINNKSAEINISGLGAGMYFVKMYSEQQVHTLKIQVER